MKFSIIEKNNCIDILRTYKGKNPYILSLQNEVVLKGNLEILNDFAIEYIKNNINTNARYINKLIKVSEWFALSKQKEWEVEFIPNKLKITWFLGETEDFYHVYVQYRQSIPPSSMFLPKKAVLTDFLMEDYHSLEIDFSRYDNLSKTYKPNEDHSLKEHQKEAVQFLVSRKKCILADDMGMGKSTSLTVASKEGNFDCVLVICPASLKTNWLRELSFYVPIRDITIIGGFDNFKKTDYELFLGYGEGKSGKKLEELKEEALSLGKWRENRYVIINFDILKDVFELPVSKRKADIEKACQNRPLLEFIKGKKSLIIVDEAHKLSENSSSRYKIVKELIKCGNPDSIYLSTGTPLTNNPSNYYNLLTLIDAPVAKDYKEFLAQYCTTIKIPISPAQKEKRDRITRNFLYKVGKNTWYDLTSDERSSLSAILDKSIITREIIKGGKNLDELKEKTAHLYLRRLKEDLNGLPPKNIFERVYELNAVQMMEYKKLWDEYVLMKAEENPNKVLDKSLLEGAIYRKYLSNLMVENTIELTNSFLKENEKVVIACCYDEELYTLQEYFGEKCVIYNGKMSLKEKDESKKRFMEDPTCMVFIGNIIAAGVGITLTSSRTLIFNNMSWTYADNSQMCDRVHRIGQTRPVSIYYQYYKDTQYEHMMDIVKEKEHITKTVIKSEKEK